MTRALIVTREADPVRRQIGSTGWAALEYLALTAQDDLTVDATARSIADDLPLSKDTAAAALRRLRAKHLLEPIPQQRTQGRFATAGYRLHLPPGLALSTDPPAPPPARPRQSEPAARRPPRPQDPVAEQLVLLPPPPPPEPLLTPPTRPSQRLSTLTTPDPKQGHELASSDASPTGKSNGQSESGPC